MTAALMFGLIDSATLSLMPVYGLRMGLDDTWPQFVLSIFVVGAILAQIPIGLAGRPGRAAPADGGQYGIAVLSDRRPAVLRHRSGADLPDPAGHGRHAGQFLYGRADRHGPAFQERPAGRRDDELHVPVGLRQRDRAGHQRRGHGGSGAQRHADRRRCLRPGVPGRAAAPHGERAAGASARNRRSRRGRLSGLSGVRLDRWSAGLSWLYSLFMRTRTGGNAMTDSDRDDAKDRLMTSGPIYRPRYAGIATFMRQPFRDEGDWDGIDIGMIGVPFDGGVTNRPGARHGPRELRSQSTLMGMVNYQTGVRPYDLARFGGSGRRHDRGRLRPRPGDRRYRGLLQKGPRRGHPAR